MMHPNAPNGPNRGPDREKEGDFKEPPYNEEMERAILGAILLKREVFYEAAAHLRAGDFYRESHRHIWRAMERLMDNGEAIDVLTLGETLEAGGLLHKVGGPNVLVRLSNEVPSAAGVSSWVEKVKEKARLRRIIVRANDAIASAYRADEPSAEIAGRLMDAIDIRQETNERRMNTKQIDRELGEVLLNKDESRRTFSTGIISLDQATRNMIAAGRMIYLAALSKMGKTSLILAILVHLLQKHGFAADYWSVEMPHVDIEARMVSSITGIPFDEVWDRLSDGQQPLETMSGDKAKQISKGREIFRSLDLEVEMAGRPNIRDIELQTRARVQNLSAARRKKFVLVVDYIQLCVAGRQTDRPYADLAEVAKRLNGLCKDLGICVIAAAQFDKQADKRYAHQNKRPRFSDIRGLSQAGNDANHQLVLHRPYRERDNGDEEFCQVYHELSRHGGMGNVADLRYIEDTCRFESWQGDRPPKKLSSRDSGSGGANQGAAHWSEHSSF